MDKLIDVPGHLFNSAGISPHPLNRAGIVPLPRHLGGSKPLGLAGSPLYFVTDDNARVMVQGINAHKITHILR